MHPDDEVCLCFHVSLRKIRTYLKREDPPVASLISECLGAGTGCQWCVPFLKHLHAQHARGERPDLRISPQRYAEARLSYHKSGVREAEVVQEAALGAGDESAGARGEGNESRPAGPPQSPPERAE
jgi:bacterioferritin-associated ferredoxin